MYKRKTLGKVYNSYFLETILQRFLYYMAAHNLDTQIEGLHKLVPVTKRKLFVIMKFDREEDTGFYLTFSQ